MKEKATRSLVKTISWRITGTVDTIVIAFFVTGNVSMALSIGVVEVFTKLLLYYLHERAWNKASFGRIEEKPIEYQI